MVHLRRRRAQSSGVDHMPGPASCDMRADPTTRLPPEILTEIFLFAICTVFAEDWLHPYHPPWILGQICSRWRAIALSTPRLWCSMESFPMNKKDLPLSSLISVVSMSLERSGRSPLKLVLKTHWFEELLNLLLIQSSRWEDVSISGLNTRPALSWQTGRNFTDSILTTLRKREFPCLRTLQFRVCDIQGEPLGIVFPTLTSLTLASSPVDILKHLSTPLLGHLRLEYSSSHNTSHDIHSFLRRSACSLTRLGLSHIRINGPELISLLGLLSDLTELIIYCAISGTIDAFLLGLLSKTVPCVAPKLKCLALDGELGQNDLLLNTIESRCEEYHYGNNEMACDPLLSVQLYSYNSFGFEAKTRLRALSNSMDIGVFESRANEWVRIEDPETDSEGSES